MIHQEIHFTENQRFKQWWLWVLILALDGFFLSMLYMQMVMMAEVGDRPVSNGVLMAAAVTVVLLTLVFANLKLITRIERDGIYVKFFPFHLGYKHYSWDNIARSYLRNYKPLAEYGGWGIRYSITGKGMTYNVSGNQGLQLELKNGSKVLIGTAKPGELQAALDQLNQAAL